MSVGLPGSGIGGLFYLVSALFMPIDSTVRALRRRGGFDLRLVIRQATLALLIVLALLATGWLLDHLLLTSSGASFAFARTGSGQGRLAVPHILRAATFAIAFGTLGGVLLTVQILRVFFAPAVAVAEVAQDSERAAA